MGGSAAEDWNDIATRAARLGDQAGLRCFMDRYFPGRAKHDGVTPLMALAEWGAAEAVEILLNREPLLLQARDHEGADALMWAARSCEPAMVPLLLRWRARTDRRDGRGLSALDHAMEAGEHGAALLLLGRLDANPLEPAARSCLATCVGSGLEPTLRDAAFDRSMAMARHRPSLLDTVVERLGQGIDIARADPTTEANVPWALSKIESILLERAVGGGAPSSRPPGL